VAVSAVEEGSSAVSATVAAASAAIWREVVIVEATAVGQTEVVLGAEVELEVCRTGALATAETAAMTEAASPGAARLAAKALDATGMGVRGRRTLGQCMAVLMVSLPCSVGILADVLRPFLP